MGVFNKNFGKLADAIITESTIYSPVSLQSKETPKVFKNAVTMWDTGSTCTLISPMVVEQLSLKSIGSAELIGVGGGIKRKVYLVHLALPDGSLIPNLQVVEEENLDSDVLIGMDVITATDFCISNKEAKTAFALRVPSKEHVEFADM